MHFGWPLLCSGWPGLLGGGHKESQAAVLASVQALVSLVPDGFNTLVQTGLRPCFSRMPSRF
jgi:hypothetical protein